MSIEALYTIGCLGIIATVVLALITWKAIQNAKEDMLY